MGEKSGAPAARGGDAAAEDDPTPPPFIDAPTPSPSSLHVVCFVSPLLPNSSSPRAPFAIARPPRPSSLFPLLLSPSPPLPPQKNHPRGGKKKTCITPARRRPWRSRAWDRPFYWEVSTKCLVSTRFGGPTRGLRRSPRGVQEAKAKRKGSHLSLPPHALLLLSLSLPLLSPPASPTGLTSPPAAHRADASTPGERFQVPCARTGRARGDRGRAGRIAR